MNTLLKLVRRIPPVTRAQIGSTVRAAVLSAVGFAWAHPEVVPAQWNAAAGGLVLVWSWYQKAKTVPAK